MIRVVFCAVIHVALHPEALIAKRVPELFHDRIPLFVLDRRLDQNRQELHFEVAAGAREDERWAEVRDTIKPAFRREKKGRYFNTCISKGGKRQIL